MPGHGVGGMPLPMIGKRDRDIAGFIVMAGISRPLEEVLIEQLRYIYERDGGLSPVEKRQHANFADEAARVKDPDLSPEILPFEIPAAYWLDIRGYDPPPGGSGVGEAAFRQSPPEPRGFRQVK